MKRIFISGEIGIDVKPSAFRADLAEAKGKDVEIVIASPGGYVYEGLEFFNAIRDYKRDHPKAKVNIVLKGLAASMASYIACCPAADLVKAEDNAVFMIHNAWSYSAGDHRELRKTADLLEGLSSISAKAYAARTGKSQDEMQSLMDAETWYFGPEIKDAGFVHEIIEAEDKDADKDKAAAIAAGRAAFASVAAKMRDAGARAREDVEQAAAVLREEGITYTTPAGGSGGPSRPAVTASQLQSLTLDELKYLNPEMYSRFLNQARKEVSEAFLRDPKPQHVPDEDPWEAPAAAAREDNSTISPEWE